MKKDQLNKTKHPLFGKRQRVTFELREDGWYYSSTGHRFHALKYPDGSFSDCWDLERVE